MRRRQFIGRGLGALAFGLLARSGLRATDLLAGAEAPTSNPFLRVPRAPASIRLDGLPFEAWYTGDGFKDSAIPFHLTTGIEPPAPGEHVEVAVIGGGISGLATAYFLRRHSPVLFELRDRFGGNALAESWDGIPYSLGSAYVITPDRGSFLEKLYVELGLDRVFRASFPPDLVELNGEILEDFWSGAGLSREERRAFEAYAEVVTYMAEKAYPEIPLPEDPRDAAWILELDGKTFRQDVEQRMGLPMTPLLAAGVQAYFYSSFCAGIDEISAASGWNFVAAEEFGRWVFPGGNGYMAWALWERLSASDIAAHPGGPRLRAGCRVVDVRLDGDRVLVTWVDPDERLRSLTAEQVVMAGAKHICKYVLHDLERLDPAKLQAIDNLQTGAYLVGNLLLESPIELDFYDTFLVGDRSFPMDPEAVDAARLVIDMLRGDYARPNHDGRSVLTLYWPYAFGLARLRLLNEGWQAQGERLVPQVREMLALLRVPESAVAQARITRWGHAMPIARPGFIAGGDAERVQRPIGGRIHFVNQDNWALPAVENSVLDARHVADRLERLLDGTPPSP